MNCMYTLSLGSTNFPKSFRPFQKPRCQKSYTEEVHKLKCRHCLGVEAQTTWKYLQYVCHFPYIYNNMPTNKESPHTPQCTIWLHIYRKQSKTGSYTWAFLDIEEASDSTSCDITKDAKWHGPQRHTIAMDQLHAGRPKNESYTHRSDTGGVCDQGLSTEGHFTPQLWSLVEDELIEGLNGNGCYTLGYMLSSSMENSQIMSHSFFRRLWVWNSSGVVKLRYQTIHKRFSTWINILVTRLLRLDLLAGHLTLLEV